MKHTFDNIPEAKKQRIINACIDEFGAWGYEKCTTDKIIKKSGISKGGLYEYISSKKELYIFTVEYTYTHLYDYLRKRIREDSEKMPDDILDRIYYISTLAIDFYMLHPQFVSLIVKTHQLADDSILEEINRIFYSQFLDIFGDSSEKGLNFQQKDVIDLLMWLLLKTRHDFLREMEKETDPDKIRSDYMKNWKFYVSVLKNGIYKHP